MVEKKIIKDVKKIIKQKKFNDIDEEIFIKLIQTDAVNPYVNAIAKGETENERRKACLLVLRKKENEVEYG